MVIWLIKVFHYGYCFLSCSCSKVSLAFAHSFPSASSSVLPLFSLSSTNPTRLSPASLPVSSRTVPRVYPVHLVRCLSPCSQSSVSMSLRALVTLYQHLSFTPPSQAGWRAAQGQGPGYSTVAGGPGQEDALEGFEWVNKWKSQMPHLSVLLLLWWYFPSLSWPVPSFDKHKDLPGRW